MDCDCGRAGCPSTVVHHQAYATADAAYVQPFDHLKLPFNVLAGFYVFGWVPGGNLWLGAALIIAASLFIAHRESQLQKS